MSRTLKTFRGRMRQGLWAGLVGLAMLPSLSSAQSPDKARRINGFNLAAGPGATSHVNQFQCGLLSTGPVCADPTSNPVLSGAFWPTGSANGQMYSAGVQLMGFTPMDENCSLVSRLTSNTPTCFPWSGDTAGAIFYGFGGGAPHGKPLTPLYDALNPADLAAWPAAGILPDFPDVSAYVTDTSMFAPVLIGSKTASQQDTWVAYWDGDPVGTSSGRPHPMGILTEQRTMAWNYPSGNEATVYMVWRMTNVTNNSLFQSLNENRFFGGADRLPNSGWTYDSVWFAFDSDPDITNSATDNYATGIFPFNMSLAYESHFHDADYSFPKALFHSPFYENAPGITGMKYLRSPIDSKTGQELGMSSLSMHTNGGNFPDPGTVQKTWRYVSLNVDASKGDTKPCNVGTTEQVKAARSCYLAQTPADVRIFMGSGPFSLAPGQTITIAVAMMAAAVTSIPTYVPGADAPPGSPTLAPGCNGQPVRLIEQLSGWVNSGPCTLDATGLLDQHTVKIVRGSLLGKALVAQTVFDNKFLLGFAPEAPDFFLVPASDKVTVVWSPSPTDVNGDPFCAAACDPANALYDANYRKFDVEGYRIFRGTSPSNLQLIAQFDKADTQFKDVLCVTDPQHVTGDPCPATASNVPISSPFVQYTNNTTLSDGSVISLAADTALAEEIRNGVAQPLSDTGIPYVFEDNTVHNGFTYYYQVRAFDINTVLAGPSSLESAATTKSVLVRASANGFSSASYSLGLFGRGKQLATCVDGGTCSPTTADHTIDPVTGEFSGPAAPTNLVSLSFTPAAPQLLPVGKTVATIDSVIPRYYLGGAVGSVNTGATLATAWMTVNGQAVSTDISGVPAVTAQPASFQISVPVASDPTARADLLARGVTDAAPPIAGALTATFTVTQPHESSMMSDWGYKLSTANFNPLAPTTGWAGGSRWFVGSNESTPDPTETVKPSSHGALPGMTIFAPTGYMGVALPAGEPRAVSTVMANYVFPAGVLATGTSSQNDQVFRRFELTTMGVTRSADMKIFWGAAGVDSVIDVTHNVPIKFSSALRSSYGFLQDADGNGVLNYGDFYYIPGLEGSATIGLASQRRPSPLAAQPVVMSTDVTGDLAGDGNGFGLYISGEPYLFTGAVPVNTVWTLRSYNGNVVKSAAGAYSYTETARNPLVPGLAVGVDVSAAEALTAANVDLSKVHTVPDPYYGVSLYDYGPTIKELQFVNLPIKATIRIYSLSGVLVTVLNHEDQTGGGIQPWNLRNRSNQFVASGVYLFHVSTPDGKEAVGKFTVINQGS